MLKKIEQLVNEDCCRMFNNFANIVSVLYGSVQAILNSALNMQLVVAFPIPADPGQKELCHCFRLLIINVGDHHW